MPFDLAAWKAQAAEKLKTFTRTAAQASSYMTYSTLAAMTLWPVVEAIGKGDVNGAITSLMGVGASVGAGIITQKALDWKYKTDAELQAEAAQWIEETVARDDALKQSLDAILTKLDAPQLAQAGLSDADRAWFVHTLREETQRIGSTVNVTIYTGGGGYIGGNLTATNSRVAMRDQFIIDTYIAQVIQTGSGESEATALELVREYLDDAMRRCAKMKWDAITDSFVRQGGAPPELADVFVPLDVRFSLSEEVESLADFAARRKRPQPKRRHEKNEERQFVTRREERRVAATDVLGAFRRAVLLGKPGSGKTTLSAYVVLHLARAASGDATALAALGESWTHGPLMPVQIILRRLADSLPAHCKQGNASHVWEFLRSHAGLPEQARLVDVLRRIARKHGALFVFDGLDECGDEARQARVREAVFDFMDTAGEECRYLITARPYAWDDPSPENGEFVLDDLTPEQVQQFVQQWFQRLHAKGWFDDDERDDKLARLREFVRRDDVRALAANPLLLTLMAMLQSNQLKLPDERVELYADVVKLSLERWTRKAGDDQSLPAALGKSDAIMDRLREAIERVAFEAHQRHAGKAGDVELDANALGMAFARVLDNDAGKADLALDYIEYRAGLLIGEGVRGDKRKFSLIHQTFQAYLAARHLARQPDFLKQAQTLVRSDVDHWRTALVMAARMERDRAGIMLTEQLAHGQALDEFTNSKGEPALGDWRAAILAGEQFIEIGRDYALGSDDGQRAHKRIVSWLLGATTSRTLAGPKVRVRAGDVLAELGDPRAHVLDVNAMHMCYVPPGEFIMGGDRYDDEKPEHPQRVKDGFWIGRTPVTQAQFAQFVEAAGYQNKSFWPEAIAAERWKDGKFRDRSDNWRERPAQYDGAFILPNHPVVGVSWYEALAFCRWMTSFLPSPPSGEGVGVGFRLPTEVEWEYAARGPRFVNDLARDALLIRPAHELASVEQFALASLKSAIENRQSKIENRRAYPWGDDPDAERMNYAETGIGSTSAVGAFPLGASPFGCEDMSGNVWEWTMTKWTSDYEDYDRQVDNRPDASEETRVVRGGSFGSYGDDSRCASRYHDDPDSRSDSGGFRLVASPIGL
jgi:formylglycine-generating enzyme required for sulfatase activity